jgi:3-hydroxybutyryl-CoA dehydrogenase
MGAGIAEVLARGGLSVVGVEVDEQALERGRGHLRRSTGRAVERGRLTEAEQRGILDRVAFATGFDGLADCDLVIEAVPERLDLKRAVFAELDRVCRADAVLATNTSSLSVTEIAAGTSRPAAVVGVHFFNPAPVMKLVEVIATVRTDSGAVSRVAELVTSLGKTPVTIGDRAGFVANRLLFGYLNQAAAMLDSGHATRDDIDAAMKTGAGLPMGPFTLMDLIGLDTCLQVLDAIYAESRDRRHAAAPLLRQLVAAGLLGRKTGRGFYAYDSSATGEPEPAAPEGPPPVVGIVGVGPLADAIAALCDRAGGQVRDSAAELAGCDLVVEAAEDAEAGRALLSAAAQAVKPGAVLAVTSVDGTVIRQAMATGRPGDVVGLHLPDPAGPLVEIAATVATTPGLADRAAGLAARLGLVPVRCRDRAGLIVDALRVPYLNDAAAMLGAGYADADSIDAAMTLGCGYPTGPIADLDRLGAGRAVTVLRALHAETRDPAFAPAPLLVEHATAGIALR